ncbi:MAG: hypothetical protein ABIY55_12735 [Kofleriaceae bacterium]
MSGQRTWAVRGVWLSACLAAVGCGDNLVVLADATVQPDPFRTALHVQMPAMSEHAKIVLAHAQLVTVTFDDDPARAEAEAFGTAAMSSSWYATVGEEYLISNPPADKPPLTLRLAHAPAMLTRADLAALIPSTPVTDDEVLYLIYVPPQVQRGADLVGLRGYHSVVARDDRQIPFAVVLEDDDRSMTGLTANAGRQLINAVTSPYPDPRDGYFLDPLATDPWSLVIGGPADLCVGEAPVVEHGVAYPLVYSNQFAETGFPCKPGRAEDPWTDVTARPARMPLVRRDTTATFQLTGWSTSEVLDWQLELRSSDRSAFTRDQMRPVLTEVVINNGRIVTLFLHVPAEAPSGAVGGVYVLSGVNSHPWAVGFVVQ